MIRMATGFLVLLEVAGGLAGSEAAPPKGVRELKSFYQLNCVRCHGQDGGALSPEGKPLKGFDFTSAEGMKGKTDEALARTLRKGIFFGIAMPAFKDRLTEEEARVMVREILRKAEKGKAITP